ncbi:hypothetical protein OA529_04540, partial [Alphaproteobacteria bacterium]|nr:hypothetical protein [Alphaproteobacteria bacterium]
TDVTNELDTIIEDYCHLLNVDNLVREFCLNLAVKPQNLYKRNITDITSIIPKVMHENSDFLKLSKILSIFIMTNSEFENKRLYPNRSNYVY